MNILEDANCKFSFGDEVQDTLTKLKGIITSVSIYITGCNVYNLTRVMTKTGELPEIQAFDEDRLKLIKPFKKKPVRRSDSGAEHRASNHCK